VEKKEKVRPTHALTNPDRELGNEDCINCGRGIYLTLQKCPFCGITSAELTEKLKKMGFDY